MSATRSTRGYTGFFAGTLATQFVNSALHLAQPLLIADLTGSFGHAAFFSSFDTAVHMGGTFLAGWPVDRFGARRVLVAATFLRGVALGAIPVLLLMGAASVPWVMGWYTLDAFVRGFTDSAEYSVPLEFARHDQGRLDALNSRFEIFFNLGGIAGPLALGGLMLWVKGTAAHAMIPLGFFASAAAFALMPQARLRQSVAREGSVPRARKRGGSWDGVRVILGSRGLLIACLGYMSFNMYPLRKLLGASFARLILGNAPAAGMLGAAFGLGGLAGAAAYARKGAAVSSFSWVMAGAGGMLVLALGWIPGSLAVMAAASFLFAFANAGARLCLTRLRQELTPLDEIGGVTAVSRFGANLISVAAKGALGAAFAFGVGARPAFALVGLFLAAVAFSQMAYALAFFRGKKRAQARAELAAFFRA